MSKLFSVKYLQSAITSVSLALSMVFTASYADDLDIYNNSPTLAPQAPLTFLVLDLNVQNATDVVCDNPLLGTSDGCKKLQTLTSVGELAGLLGISLNALPLLPGLDINKPIADLSTTVRTLLAGLAPGITGLVTGLTGGLNGPITNQLSYLLSIQKILTSVIDSKVAIILNHSNRGPTSAQKACAFGDAASLGGTRFSTTACSNGSYFFKGLTNLANPVELLGLTNKLVTSLANPSTILSLPGLTPANLLDAPYQTKEIYVELAKYLRGDVIYNGHLGYFDYGDTNPANNLNSSFPVLSWDSTIESGNGYNSALAANPDTCAINLIHLQVSNEKEQDDSDTALKALFPTADQDGNGSVTTEEIVSAAGTDGFSYGADFRKINSSFVIQENLTSVGTLTQRGENVVSYANSLGLLGLGKDIGAKLIKPLIVDASVGTISAGSKRNSPTGLTGFAYFPQFRPAESQKPAWFGNVKRLRFNDPSTSDFTLKDATNQAAIATDGRIKASSLTYWTPGSAPDGRITDKGGAGANIPGYSAVGLGDPARNNPGSPSTTARTVFYDSYLTSAPSGTDPTILLKPLSLNNGDTPATVAELKPAVGATAFTGPAPSALDACGVAYTACRTGALVSCTAQETTCNLGCTTMQTTCLLGCEGRLFDAFTACTNACNSTASSCLSNVSPPGCSQKATACNSACDTELASCNAGTSTSRTADEITKELLLYARGYDVGTHAAPKGGGANATPTSTNIYSRSWMLGGVFHSRPIAINYGKRVSTTSDDVRVVFGSNDGMLHMTNDATGAETWSFIPQTQMGALKTLRENSTGAALPYGVDGSPVVLIRDGSPSGSASPDFIINKTTSSNKDRVLLFFGLRRGGSEYYALDVTDPDAPNLVWKIGTDGLRNNTNVGVVAGTASHYAKLGLTFSTPKAGRMQINFGSSTTPDLKTVPVLIFAGGYNGGRTSGGSKIGKDFYNSRAALATNWVGVDDGVGSSDRGNAVFIVNAETGELIWKAERGTTASFNNGSLTYSHPLLVDSIPSDVTALDTNNDNRFDRLYVGDTGGRMWRADFGSVERSAWTITPIASVGRHALTVATLADDRRFFHAPDYIPVRTPTAANGTSTAYDIILFGTGDREDPFNVTTVNWVYALRDSDTVSGKTASEIITTEAGLSTLEQDDFEDQTTKCAAVDAGATCKDVVTLSPGYKFKLEGKGEKALSTPITTQGLSVFNTYLPVDLTDPLAPKCVPQEGTTKLYSISARDSRPKPYVGSVATTRSVNSAVPGLPPQTVALSPNTVGGPPSPIKLKVRSTYRTSWRERLGDDEKLVTPPAN